MPTEQEMDAAIDAAMDDALKNIGIENDTDLLEPGYEPEDLGLEPPVDDELPPIDEEEELPDLDEEEEEVDLTPQGEAYTYDEWVAAGKDPAKFMAPEMLEKYRQEIGEKKQFKQERNEQREMMELMKRTFLQTQQAQRDQYVSKIQELQQDMLRAKSNYDFDGYEAAGKEANALARKVQELDQQAVPEQPQDPYANENPIIRNYRLMEPRLHQDSEEYDPEYNNRFEAEFNAQALQNKPQTAQDIAKLLRATEKKLATPSQDGQQNPPEAPQRRRSKPPRVASPNAAGGATGGSGGASNMPDDVKQLYNQWRKSSDPTEKAAARELYETYGGKK